MGCNSDFDNIHSKEVSSIPNIIQTLLPSPKPVHSETHYSIIKLLCKLKKKSKQVTIVYVGDQADDYWEL